MEIRYGTESGPLENMRWMGRSQYRFEILYFYVIHGLAKHSTHRQVEKEEEKEEDEVEEEEKEKEKTIRRINRR